MLKHMSSLMSLMDLFSSLHQFPSGKAFQGNFPYARSDALSYLHSTIAVQRRGTGSLCGHVSWYMTCPRGMSISDHTLRELKQTCGERKGEQVGGDKHWSRHLPLFQRVIIIDWELLFYKNHTNTHFGNEVGQKETGINFNLCCLPSTIDSLPRQTVHVRDRGQESISFPQALALTCGKAILWIHRRKHCLV